MLRAKEEYHPHKHRAGKVEVVINRDTVFPFLGMVGSRSLVDLLEGNSQVELKGSSFWLYKLERRVDHIGTIQCVFWFEMMASSSTFM